MELEKKVKTLQLTYAGVLADSVLRLGREGILDKVTEDKHKEQLMTGKVRAVQFGINTESEVFTKLSDIYGCANWSVNRSENGITAETTSCMLCAIAKKMGTQSPCRIYCLDPMEGLVKGINPEADYIVSETLWDGAKCSVTVK